MSTWSPVVPPVVLPEIAKVFGLLSL